MNGEDGVALTASVRHKGKGLLVLSHSRDCHFEQTLIEICLYFCHVGVSIKMNFPFKVA